jgi:hypothetical protein
MTTFTLDGKTHAVEPEDCVILYGPMLVHGPTLLEGDRSNPFILKDGDTLTMGFEELRPGESITIDHVEFPLPRPFTMFFRPMTRSEDRELTTDNNIKEDA